ncbi:hypothetical protein JKG68_20395 [Microvirga aerilata]|uniref:Uncharacterized protein n=1 Tax=Microvirga aerilata TaxID=670292 RepID=A0A937D1W3_9HYPH|nr:hypothetical protein [Microvirga aerilata]MBL0406322.1 hypothetical protein [Microvirga aerilata]
MTVAINESGQASSANFVDFGHHTFYLDKQTGKTGVLNRGEFPPIALGLSAYMAKNIPNRRLSFTTIISQVVPSIEV